LRFRLSLRGTNSSLHEIKAQLEQTPPDAGASEVRQTVIKFKRKLHLGERMIGTRVQVKYEENVEG